MYLIDTSTKLTLFLKEKTTTCAVLLNLINIEQWTIFVFPFLNSFYTAMEWKMLNFDFVSWM